MLTLANFYSYIVLFVSKYVLIWDLFYIFYIKNFLIFNNFKWREVEIPVFTNTDRRLTAI